MDLELSTVTKEVDLFHQPTRWRAPRGSWNQDNPGQWSRTVAIHYPPAIHIFYVVDALRPDHPNADDSGWFQLEGTHMIKELADNVARKRAYYDQVPYRVREVAWDG